ncbi:type I restriction-modification system subunit M [Calditerrivibrio nitroreducens]|uniref:site-specific DNA-methyltransferase (adenine-specific) n=1 Tax=Calditerrivibrio nitroreducens (strain DSM 19672 / NBRC 101217 / Yu37-1) TaxID=768670 RepID=E4TGP2_CALNY|nr:class I SAM-dependent DNA methyltransferase [Calditerrivibrio nitroreducens]ADR19755.1 Site-specific DNA-methyltransferase (adenine-specific) [Calditerrivibrio nitroreducens DSM 19672]
MSDIVNKLWGMCHTLRHDGIDYGDYIEQLTYLLFIKMADEKGIELPENCDWETLKNKSGTELTDHYLWVLQKLRDEKGLLGDIFAQSMPKFNNPVNLKKIITMIDAEDWSSLGVDVKAQAFEGLLEKAASEGKKGAGQYFTPRVLIQSIVRVMKPDPLVNKEMKICDPACGTGGFLVAAYEWLIEKTGGAIPVDEIKRIKENTYYGQELVARPRRLALMNLFLHGLKPTIYLGDTIYEPDRGERYDIVLTNPPFGTKGAGQIPTRDDFTVATSNKQLNFVQHIMTILKKGGRAAIVLPDNCLFEDKAVEVFKIVMEDCNLHTILRLPRGTFVPYANAQANVVFLQKGIPTEKVWIYDCRSNIPSITKKDRPLTAEMFADFEQCYGKDPNGNSPRIDQGPEGRFRAFTIDEIKERGYKLDIKWLKDDTLDDPNDLPEPSDLIAEAVSELEAVVDELNEINNLLEGEL